ncbi:N-acetylneuraminate lyase [Haemophilus parainfluenzae]|nr:N-acetylneuraminate lyase [Haemophilus parainfluenzae]
MMVRAVSLGVDSGYCREPMTAKATPEQLAKAKELKAKYL